MIAEVIYGYNGLVFESRYDFGFFLKARDEFWILVELLWQKLDCDFSIKTRIEGSVNDGHPPTTKLAQYLITADTFHYYLPQTGQPAGVSLGSTGHSKLASIANSIAQGNTITGQET